MIGYFLCERMKRAAKRIELARDALSCTGLILRGHSCSVIILNVLSPAEDTRIKLKGSLY